LPEAQLDRFLLKISLGYPSLEDEAEILRRFEGDATAPPPVAVDAAGIISLQRARGEVKVGDAVRGYLLGLVRATREDERTLLGASPRASLALHRATQAQALLAGRDFALPDDVKAMALPVLAHRLIPTASARLHGETPEAILTEILDRHEVPVESALAAAPIASS
jgi:MoxR-like ATPase